MRSMSKLVFTLALTACVGVPVAWAGAPTQALENYFSSVHTLSGDFRQSTINQSGDVVDHTRGHMAIARPNRFNWVYTEPFEQKIIGDGKRLWVYDVDLEQVTVRPMKAALGAGPALMLSGNWSDLKRQFSIGEDGQWVVLTPRTQAWDLNAIRLKFDGDTPAAVEVEGSMGHVTKLTFQNLKRNPDLQAGLFDFQPPKGVDVIGNTGQGGSEQ